jgi:sulfite reductase (ferredoxin)
LLVTQAVEPTSHELVLKEFEQRMVDKGVIARDAYQALRARSEALKNHVTADNAKAYVGEAKMLVAACKTAFSKIDASLKVGHDATAAPAAPAVAAATAGPAPAIMLDLLGVACPMNYVKTKLQLEEMEPLQILEVLLDAGEPAENVPRSVKSDGYRVVSLEEEAGHYRLVIENKAE